MERRIHRKAPAILCFIVVIAYVLLPKCSVSLSESSTIKSRNGKPSIKGSLVSVVNSTQKFEYKVSIGRAFYWQVKGDRPGLVLFSIYHAHAYAFRENVTYGGACIDNVSAQKKKSRINTYTEILKALRLSDFVRFRCPIGRKRHQIIKGTVFRDDRYITPDFVDFLRQQQGQADAESKSKVVVHIRRGDVNPCAGTWHRYTPNWLYLQLLQKLMAEGVYKPADVTIISQSNSAESFDAFNAYHVELDIPQAVAYRQMVNAEVLIMSRSIYSYPPAILNTGRILYEPFFHDPMEWWELMDESLLREARIELGRLQEKLCAV